MGRREDVGGGTWAGRGPAVSWRLRAALLGGVLLGGGAAGCAAAGRPLGDAARARTGRYRPLTPPAAPRQVPSPGAPTRAALPAPAEARLQVLARARALLGRERLVLGGRAFPASCDGFIAAAYGPLAPAGPAVAAGDNAVTALYRRVAALGGLFREGAPRPGDLAFFRDTYDLNRDGRANDGLTHVALVEAVEGDGRGGSTVTLLHHVSRGVVRERLTPARPSERADPASGRVLNHVLRGAERGRSAALAGELFVSYGALLPPGPGAAAAAP